MKKIFFTLILFHSFFIVCATTYYIKNGGNNANTGLSDAQAWTVTKLLTFVPAANDLILFKRGETFTSPLTLLKSATSAAAPVTYGAYGTGEKPIITSLTTLTGWTLHSGKIYKVSGIPANCNVVTVNGVSTEKGHFPASGFGVWDSYTFSLKNISAAADYSGTVAGTTLFTTSTTHGLTSGDKVTIQGTTNYNGYYTATVVNTTQFYVTKTYVSSQAGTLTYNTTITDSDLPASPDFTGAELVLYKSNWTIDRSEIKTHSSHTLTYASASGNVMQTSGGQKYLIQNDIDCLTYTGAWFCDGSNFYMYFDGNNPNSYTVQAGTSDYTISLSSKNYNTVRDLDIRGGNVSGVYCTSSTGFSFKNCNLQHTGLTGLKAVLSTITTVDSCTFSYVNGTSITINSAGSFIRHNTVNWSGKFAGMGESGGGSHYGIYSKGTNNIVQYNFILNTGYIPVYIESSGFDLGYNLIDTYPTLGLNDGGGAYTFASTTPQSGQKMHHNVIMNSTANGLYTDGLANHVEIYANVVYNVDKWALHMNEPIGNNVHDNTFFDFGLAGIDVTNQYIFGSPAGSDNVVSNNLIIQANALQKFYSLQDANTNNAVLSFGTSNNNTFIADNSATTVFYNQKGSASSLPFSAISYTWADWKTLTGKESASAYSLYDVSTLTFLYNDTMAPKAFSLTGAKVDLSGNVYETSVTLQPFTSLLLIPTIINNPANLIKVIIDATGKPLLDADGKPLLIP